MIFFRIMEHGAVFALPWIATILISLGVHEFAHALAGYLQGDDTAEREGRLTLNPMAHVDWWGFGLLLLVGFGWGKPTPFNPHNLKFKKWGGALVGLAGPISNILMAIAAIVVFKLLGFENLNWTATNSLLEAFLLFMVQINVVLAIFNLIPIPPLDGSKILYAFMGPSRWRTIQTLEQRGPIFLLLFIIFGQGILSTMVTGALVVLFTVFGLI